MSHNPLNSRKGKTILVTGGCGYLGSQTIRCLANDPALEDITIRVFDNLQTGSYLALMDLPSRGKFQFIEGDILDPGALRMALDGVDWVVHLAAVVRSPLNFNNFAWTVQVNQWGTAQLVEACIQAKVKHFIYASAAAVYGPGGPFDESATCRPLGSYAQSKLRAEASVKTAVERGLPSTILRLGTLYGYAPVIHFDTVANRFAIIASTKRPLTVYGRGDQIRPFVHVRDAGDAIAFCLANPELSLGKLLNVHSENHSVLDLVEELVALDPKSKVRFTEQDILTHLSFSILSDQLRHLGWKPKITLHDGLEELLTHLPNISPLLSIYDGLMDDF